MAKFEVKEVRGKWRDPRAEETSASSEPTNPPSSSRPMASRPPTSADELMRILRGPGPAPAPAAKPAQPAATAAPKVAPAPPAAGTPPPALASSLLGSKPRDLFGIVGTTQADVFQIEDVVAHGGFSVIYKAKHLRFSAPAALKCLKIPPTLTRAERDDFLLKFKKEGELMFRLSSSCPEVVRPLSLDSFKLSDGQVVPFIALEWLDGETLKDTIIRRLEDGKPPLSIRRAVSILTPVARTLARAHSFPSPAGRLAILHCDLKPDNIFVAQQAEGEVLKIFDFGIAKVRSAATREAGGATVQSGKNMFTPAYAAPEQWSPEKFGQTGPWTDVFALAVTLTEVITQRPAIDGTAAAMLTSCLDESKRPTPRTLGLPVSDDIEEIFLQAMAVDPRARTRSVEEFWGALEVAVGLPRTLGGDVRLSLPPTTPAARLSDPETNADDEDGIEMKLPESATGPRLESKPDTELPPEEPVVAERPASVPPQAAASPSSPPPAATPASSPPPAPDPVPAPAPAPAAKGAVARLDPVSLVVLIVAVVASFALNETNRAMALGLPVLPICGVLIGLAMILVAYKWIDAAPRSVAPPKRDDKS